MRRKLIIGFFFLALAASAVSCAHKESVDDVKAKLTTQITSLEAELKAAHGELNVVLADSMIASYEQYGEAYPEDSITTFYWYRAGEIARNVPGKELYAVNYFANVFEAHPEHPLAAQAVFMTGVSFDQFGDDERAAKSFRYFLDTYPQHEWAPEAEALWIMNTDTTDLSVKVDEWLEREEK